MPPVLGLISLASTRIALFALGIAIWLISRPGGWAVLAAAALVGVKLLPSK